MKGFLAAFGMFIAFDLSAFTATQEQQCIDSSTTIDQKLACIVRLTFKEVTDEQTPQGVRQFELQFFQPVDHSNPSIGTFSQRLALIHRNEDEPMVLQTSGYSIFTVKEATVTAMFGTNQLQVEHRFFSNSKPEKLDWSKLDIKQSADDFHAITSTFKQIYSRHWLNTGSSKGGMTSIYHRRFYPDDVKGTLANVAPISFSTSDKRYIDFINSVGGEAFKVCRENLKQMQIHLLQSREEIVPHFNGTFEQLGSADVAFEHSVIEFLFYFWQYGDPDNDRFSCKAVPVNGTTQEVNDFLQEVNPTSNYSDEGLSKFLPYYYQAATQLGGPDNVTLHLESLRRYLFNLDQYTPKGVSYTYSNSVMVDVDHWVRTSGDKILFVYGEFDPWSAGQFPISETGKEIYKYFVPKGNHGSKFTKLNVEQKEQVIATLARWLDKSPLNIGPLVFRNQFKSIMNKKMLEDIEFDSLWSRHLAPLN